MHHLRVYCYVIIAVAVLLKMIVWIPLYRNDKLQISFFETFYRYYGSRDFAESSASNLFSFFKLNNFLNITTWVTVVAVAFAYVFDNKLWVD